MAYTKTLMSRFLFLVGFLSLAIVGCSDSAEQVSSIPPQSDTNSAPQFPTPPADQINIAGDTITAFAITATDSDNNNILYSASNLPPGLSIDENTGTISGSINNDAHINSPYSTQITANDQTGETNAETTVGFQWTVTPIIFISINDVETIEGDSGLSVVNFDVSLSQQSLLPISVNFATEDIDARTVDGHSDYIPNSGSVDFAANGPTSKPISIEIRGDLSDEADELFRVLLSGATNAQIQDNQGIATIVNDDVQISFTTDSQPVDESAGNISVSMQLNKVSSLDVVVPYSFEGTATRDLDYQHANTANEVTIAAGSLSTTLAITIVNDNVNGINETIKIQIGTPTYAQAGTTNIHTVTIQDNDMSRLNDTGMVRCGDYVSLSATCPIATFPGQDSDTGRDEIITNDDLNGHAAFSYTKISSSGASLAANAANWSCIKDNVTGLTWEKKSTDGGLHHYTRTYSWYDTNPDTNGGSSGSPSAFDCGGVSCDTESFVAAVNNEQFCGFNDWRVPSFVELMSIVNYNVNNPSIDTNYFPNTRSDRYWAAEPFIHDSLDTAMNINFASGAGPYGSSASVKTNRMAVRLVRGGE